MQTYKTYLHDGTIFTYLHLIKQLGGFAKEVQTTLAMLYKYLLDKVKHEETNMRLDLADFPDIRQMLL